MPPPIESPPKCNLTVNHNGLAQIILRLPRIWDTYRTEGLRIRVKPKTANNTHCTVDFGFTKNYECSGLDTGQQYTVEFSGTNCNGDQEGERDSFTVYPQGIAMTTLLVFMNNS